MEQGKAKELYLIQDDNLEVDFDESKLTEEQKKEYEELKKRYGIKE